MYGRFKYEVGEWVRLEESGRAYCIRWRGWLLVEHAAGRKREAVYRLGSDEECCWEDELRPAFAAPEEDYSYYRK